MSTGVDVDDIFKNLWNWHWYSKFFIFILYSCLTAIMLVMTTNLLQNKPKEKIQDEHWKDIYYNQHL